MIEIKFLEQKNQTNLFSLCHWNFFFRFLLLNKRSIAVELPYRVVIFPSKKYGPVTTTANVWVAISGSLCETQQVTIPRSSLEFVFHVSFIAMNGHLNYSFKLRNNFFGDSSFKTKTLKKKKTILEFHSDFEMIAN